MTCASGRDDGADIAALDDDVSVAAEVALPVAHHLPHLGMARDDRDEPVDLGAPDRRGHVGAGDEAAAVGVEVDRVLRGQPAEPRALVHRHAVAQRKPGQRPVHRARVEVSEAESLGEPARDGALAGPGGPVDRDDHALPAPPKAFRVRVAAVGITVVSGAGGSSPSDLRQQIEESGEGYRHRLRALDPHAGARDDAGDRAEHCDPMVAARLDLPTRRPGRHAPHPEPVVARPRSALRGRAARSVTVSIRSVSFSRSSCAPRTRLSPRAIAATRAKRGNSSIRPGTSAGSTSVATRSACSTSMSATGSPPDAATVVERDPRAHPLEHVQQADPGRVDADAVQPEARARQQRGGDEEGRRRREVAGHLELQRLEPLRRPHLDEPRRRQDARPGRAQEPLGVVAGRHPLDDRGRAAGRVQPGEQDARLDLRARDRQLVADRLHRAARRSGAGAARRPSRYRRPSQSAARRSAASASIAATRLRSARTAGRADRPGSPGAAWPGCRRCRSRSARPGGRSPRRPAPRTHSSPPAPSTPAPSAARSRNRRLGVGRAPEARDPALAVADRPDQHRAMRDRLVAREGEPALDRRRRLDPHSSTAEIETP